MTGRRAGRGERIGAIAAGTTAVIVTGVGLGALAAGSSEGWLVLAVGWGVGVPLAAGTGGAVASAIRAGFDAALAVVPSRDAEREIRVADGGGSEPSDVDPSGIRDRDLGHSRRS